MGRAGTGQTNETMLCILFFCIATTLAHVDIFVFKEYDEVSGSQDDPSEETFGGSLPPDLSLTSSSSSSSSSCSCSKLILSSLGPSCHLPATCHGGLHQVVDRLWGSGVLQAKLWAGLQALLATLRLDGGRCARCSNWVCA